MPNTIALFNLKYSPNLGDGIIALCLEHELRRHFVSWDMRSNDLAGRTEWGAPTRGGGRAVALSLLDQLPSWASEIVVRAALGVELRRRLLRYYKDGIYGCRFAVIGGGQLFQDRDLNFPMKVAAAAETCNTAGIPFAIYGVGATASRSQTGRGLFNRVLTACQRDVIFARDDASVECLKGLGAPRAKRCLDPGLLASDLWPRTTRLPLRRSRVGLCVTHPAVLGHHGGVATGSSRVMLDRFIALIRRLIADDHTVVCFTDGANEDELFLARCRNRLCEIETIGHQAIIWPRCTNPAELARLVSSFDVLIAHRLHACILAYSYRVPSIGLKWDSKLEAFFDLIGQHDGVVDFQRTSNDAFACRVSAALATPFPVGTQRTVLEIGARQCAGNGKWTKENPRDRGRWASRRGGGMTLEPIGWFVLSLGVLTLWRGPSIGVFLLCPMTLLGATAAIKLPALGAASIQPAHLLLGFVAISFVCERSLWQVALRSLAFPNAGFWFALFVVYGCMSAFFLPRIFAGLTYVFSLARFGDDVGIELLPLAPRPSNITQAFYLIGNFICFVVVTALVRLHRSSMIARSIVLTAVLCLVFAAADLLTYVTNTQYLLSFIRNANYRMLSDGEIGGLKRIVGSFSEAGAYSYAALALYAFVLALWLEAYPIKRLGLLCSLLLTTILLSTSSTAYAAVLIFSLITLVGCLSRSAQTRATSRQMSYVGLAFLVLPLILMATMLLSGVWSTITHLFEATIVNKLGSQSGVERMLWNEQALVTFLDFLRDGSRGWKRKSVKFHRGSGSERRCARGPFVRGLPLHPLANRLGPRALEFCGGNRDAGWRCRLPRPTYCRDNQRVQHRSRSIL